MVSVSSSAIAAIGFESGTLGIRFHSSSTVYLFYGVPYGLFQRFLNAGSKANSTPTIFAGVTDEIRRGRFSTPHPTISPFAAERISRGGAAGSRFAKGGRSSVVHGTD